MISGVGGTRLAKLIPEQSSAYFAVVHHRCAGVAANRQHGLAISRTELRTKTDNTPSETTGDI